MKTEEKKCSCGANDSKIVMACSGASDVGYLSDQTARLLQVGGERKMSCLALVGAGIEKSIENFKTKDLVIIDGCPIACGKRMAEAKQMNNYKHIVLTEHGFTKGESPATKENVQRVFDLVKENFN